MEAARGAREGHGPHHRAVGARDGRGLDEGVPKTGDARRRGRRVAEDVVEELPRAWVNGQRVHADVEDIKDLGVRQRLRHSAYPK